MARIFGSDLSALEAEARTTTIITYEEQTRGWMAYMARTKTVAEEIEAYGRLKIHLRELSKHCRAGFR